MITNQGDFRHFELNTESFEKAVKEIGGATDWGKAVMMACIKAYAQAEFERIQKEVNGPPVSANCERLCTLGQLLDLKVWMDTRGHAPFEDGCYHAERAHLSRVRGGIAQYLSSTGSCST